MLELGFDDEINQKFPPLQENSYVLRISFPCIYLNPVTHLHFLCLFGIIRYVNQVIINKITTKRELSVLALQAATIALWVIDKVSGGALEKAGANVLDFLEKRFQDKLQIKGSEPKLLEAAILSEAEWDKKFQEDLERLVTQYQQIQKIQSTSYVSQRNQSGVNLNVDKNSGTVIGQNIEKQFFR